MVPVPEWFIVGFLGIMAMIIGWWAKRMVSAYDQLVVDTTEIKVQLIKMNGRIAKSEQWQAERS